MRIVHQLAVFKARDVFNFVEEVDLIKEVKDLLEQFNEYPSLSEKCLRAFLRYVENPIESNRTELREAYMAVPLHLRIYILGDQDVLEFRLNSDETRQEAA